MRRAANFFKLDSSESDTDDERKKSSKVRVEKAVVNIDGAKRETGKRKRVDDIDLGAEENTRDELNKKKKLTSVDSEVEENSLSSKKREKKEPSEDPEAEGNANNGGAKDANQIQSENPEAEGNELKSTKDLKKKRKKKQSEDPEVEENNKGSTEDGEKRLSEDLEAEGNDLNSKKDPKKKGKNNKKKQSGDPEVGENNKGSTEDEEKRQSEDSEAEGNDLNSKKVPKKKGKKQSEDPEAEGDDLNSTEISKKKRKKTKKQSEDPEAEENNNDGAKVAEKYQSENSEAEGNGLNSTEIAKKKRKKKKQSEDPEVEENNNDGAKDAEKNQSDDSEAEGNGLNSTEIAKKKRKKKKQSEDPEAEENNGKKKRKKQKGSKSDEVVTTPSSKSAKKVKFSDQVEVFPTEDEESDEDDEEEEEEVGVVRGKRFTKEEDELIKKSVLAYVENHALGDEGVKMILDCKSHKQVRGCWKEISTVLPWRPYTSVYHRAHTIFEQGSKGVWSKEDFDLVMKYHKKYGNDWRTLADAMGKSRKHVKDAWRRIRLASKKNGHWSMEEYQNLFDLVNKDLRMKAFQEKRSKHGMIRDNIPWMAISDQIRTRDHTICCMKWYDQLTSPMVKKGIWANVDDYRLLDKLTSLDAACVDDVDWDDLLDNRDGDACRSRWNQMVNHIGIPGTKTFAEQVEILSQRYCPDIAEDREDFDNRPFDPEDED